GLSPSALMTNGEATCEAAMSPAVLRTVRRSGRLNMVGKVITVPPEDVVISPGLASRPKGFSPRPIEGARGDGSAFRRDGAALALAPPRGGTRTEWGFCENEHGRSRCAWALRYRLPATRFCCWRASCSPTRG